MWWNGFGGWWMFFAAIMMIIFWGGIIWLIVWGVRRTSYRSHMPGNGDMTPLDIAKARYARGEITREQFEEIKKNL